MAQHRQKPLVTMPTIKAELKYVCGTENGPSLDKTLVPGHTCYSRQERGQVRLILPTHLSLASKAKLTHFMKGAPTKMRHWPLFIQILLIFRNADSSNEKSQTVCEKHSINILAYCSNAMPINNSIQ